MTFNQIQTHLMESANNGTIFILVHKAFTDNDVLSATSPLWAEQWLYTSPKDAELQNGTLPTFSQIINQEVDKEVERLVKESYTGHLPARCKCPIDFINTYEDDSDYGNSEEHEASYEIHLAIANNTYCDVAIRKVMELNWNK